MPPKLKQSGGSKATRIMPGTSSKRVKLGDSLAASSRLEKSIEDVHEKREKIKKALIGYSRFDIIQNEDHIHFGKWNPWVLVKAEVSSLANSFHTVTYEKSPDAGQWLPELQITKSVPVDYKVIAAGGQHRQAALKEWLNRKRKDLNDLKAQDTCILSRGAEDVDREIIIDLNKGKGKHESLEGDHGSLEGVVASAGTVAS
ncbi:hypothetical protein EDC04DRAFT_2913489 [Pisolithus marmoratus]|nr:hypothetical protein EDC04DRAFT_2913489 [Pisolithus marmoratus]